VTTVPPDRLDTGAQEKNVVNLFLHRVSRNPGWANLGPPPRDSQGNEVAAPPLGVDLHYIVSAYGQDPLTAEILLGHAVAALYEQPVLPRAAVRRALAPNPPDPALPAAVSASKLADQVEQLRITPYNPGGEEVARVWASFNTPYRPSAFFDVSVVLVDPLRGANAPFPVRSITSGAISTEQPEVDDVRADGPAGTPVTAGALLVITGRNLAGPHVRVRVGGASAVPSSIGARELRVALSAFDHPVPAGLSGLIVTHDLDLGDPPTPHPAAASNAVPLVYRPTVTMAPADVTVGNVQTVDGVQLATGSMVAHVAPRVGRAQQAVLLLSEVGAPAARAPRGATLRAPAGNGVAQGDDDTDAIAFAFRDLPKGSYVLRLQVDGVDSPVGVDGNGRYATPSVVV
jgi:Pvc16 N-terminal domain